MESEEDTISWDFFLIRVGKSQQSESFIHSLMSVINKIRKHLFLEIKMIVGDFEFKETKWRILRLWIVTELHLELRLRQSDRRHFVTSSKVNRICLNDEREFRSKMVMECFNWINQEEFGEQGLMAINESLCG